jgi:hypothetical protein
VKQRWTLIAREIPFKFCPICGAEARAYVTGEWTVELECDKHGTSNIRWQTTYRKEIGETP